MAQSVGKGENSMAAKKPYTNPCTRCGKERIVVRTWKERVVTFSGVESIQINSDMVCPDVTCQKIVMAELDEQKEKRDKVRLDREKRLQDKKTNNPRNKHN